MKPFIKYGIATPLVLLIWSSIPVNAEDAPRCEKANVCTTSPNSATRGATIDHAGSSSVSHNDMLLMAYGTPPDTSGFFFYGSELHREMPFGDGFRCVGGEMERLSMTAANASGYTEFQFDLNTATYGAEMAPGSTWYFQYIFRDNLPAGAGFNLSDALAVTFCP